MVLISTLAGFTRLILNMCMTGWKCHWVRFVSTALPCSSLVCYFITLDLTVDICTYVLLPVFLILSSLSHPFTTLRNFSSIFLHMEAFLSFGNNGPMNHCWGEQCQNCNRFILQEIFYATERRTRERGGGGWRSNLHFKTRTMYLTV